MNPPTKRKIDDQSDLNISQKKKRMVLKSQSRVLVLKVKEFMEKEKEQNAPIIPFKDALKRTELATGVSVSTIKRIAIESATSNKLTTPGRTKYFEPRVTKLDDFEEQFIRNHIYQYYEKQEIPSVNKLLNSLKECSLFSGSATSLRRVLKTMGFECKTIAGKKLLLEKEYLSAWRSRFLRSMLKVPSFNDIVWIGESWWDDSKKGTAKLWAGKGDGPILLHAGTSQGFIPGALSFFQSKTSQENLEEALTTNFTEWFKNLLVKIKPKSILVMDCAPHRSIQIDKAPNATTSKQDIVVWLQTKNVEYNNEMKKSELLELVRLNKKRLKRTYVVETLAENQGHTVIRLPPKHSYFNPIETIWSQVKSYMAGQHPSQQTKGKLEMLWREGCKSVTSEQWQEVVNNVYQVIERTAEIDEQVEIHTEYLIRRTANHFSVSTDSEESEWESSSSEDDD